MKTYREHRPTQYDTHISLKDRETWLVVPVIHTRDSGPFAESNFYSALKMLGDESETVEVHRFGHWGPGWYEIILVDPNSPQAKIAQEIEEALENYPLLNGDDHSEREYEAACEIWEHCYNTLERVAYIRKNHSEFEFHDLTEMMACVRGKVFRGYASELVQDSGD